MAANRPAFPIPGKLVEYVLLGPANDQRQLQDSPILGDVWLAFAADPAGVQDLLITPHKKATSAQVADAIATQVAPDKARKLPDPRIAYLQGFVAARLSFEEVLRLLVPMTLWWREQKVVRKLEDPKFDPGRLQRRIGRILELGIYEASKTETSAVHGSFDALDRYIALAGLILWAGKQSRRDGDGANPSPEQVLATIGNRTGDIIAGLLDLYAAIDAAAAGKRPARGRRKRSEDDEDDALVFQISLNRRAAPALAKSVPSVKGDAARTLFGVDCSKIVWAVLDSGIDGGHKAFQIENPVTQKTESRVRKTFDFTRVRDLLSSDEKIADARLDDLLTGVALEDGAGRPLGATARRAAARDRLQLLAQERRRRRPTNWDLVEELITLSAPVRPASSHGTHVAGIIGAKEHRPERGRHYGPGMCPDIRFYDFRVLAKSPEDTEFAVIAALQYIRYVNEQHNYITVHGANLSLSIPHNVRNYACGRTPICVECERLVDNGVVVVAAAGNRGYQYFETKEGTYEGYAAFSITDPGNADGVITVGSTHGNWPHTYGVSFFSSRGPTGDGRQKPDLVAPGERVQSTVPGSEWGPDSGTSMAAPHVSGAAAMLLARYAELIGQPRRVKRILCESATDLGRERSFQGHGMLDVLRAFQAI